MKIKEFISIVSLGILICGNISSQSFANTEISNRYQAYQGESIVIDNSKNGNIEQKNATQSPSNLPKVIWEGLVA